MVDAGGTKKKKIYYKQTNNPPLAHRNTIQQASKQAVCITSVQKMFRLQATNNEHWIIRSFNYYYPLTKKAGAGFLIIEKAGEGRESKCIEELIYALVSFVFIAYTMTCERAYTLTFCFRRTKYQRIKCSQTHSIYCSMYYIVHLCVICMFFIPDKNRMPSTIL